MREVKLIIVTIFLAGGLLLPYDGSMIAAVIACIVITNV